MAEPVFKLLRCDAEASHMLGWAKKEVRRLVGFARLDAFNRTWKFGDVSVRAQYFGGVARLWLEAEAAERLAVWATLPSPTKFTTLMSQVVPEYVTWTEAPPVEPDSGQTYTQWYRLMGRKGDGSWEFLSTGPNWWDQIGAWATGYIPGEWVIPGGGVPPYFQPNSPYVHYMSLKVAVAPAYLVEYTQISLVSDTGAATIVSALGVGSWDITWQWVEGGSTPVGVAVVVAANPPTPPQYERWAVMVSDGTVLSDGFVLRASGTVTYPTPWWDGRSAALFYTNPNAESGWRSSSALWGEDYVSVSIPANCLPVADHPPPYTVGIVPGSFSVGTYTAYAELNSSTPSNIGVYLDGGAFVTVRRLSSAASYVNIVGVRTLQIDGTCEVIEVEGAGGRWTQNRTYGRYVVDARRLMSGVLSLEGTKKDGVFVPDTVLSDQRTYEWLFLAAEFRAAAGVLYDNEKQMQEDMWREEYYLAAVRDPLKQSASAFVAAVQAKTFAVPVKWENEVKHRAPIAAVRRGGSVAASISEAVITDTPEYSERQRTITLTTTYPPDGDAPPYSETESLTGSLVRARTTHIKEAGYEWEPSGESYTDKYTYSDWFVPYGWQYDSTPETVYETGAARAAYDLMPDVLEPVARPNKEVGLLWNGELVPSLDAYAFDGTPQNNFPAYNVYTHYTPPIPLYTNTLHGSVPDILRRYYRAVPQVNLKDAPVPTADELQWLSSSLVPGSYVTCVFIAPVIDGVSMGCFACRNDFQTTAEFEVVGTVRLGFSWETGRFSVGGWNAVGRRFVSAQPVAGNALLIYGGIKWDDVKETARAQRKALNDPNDPAHDPLMKAVLDALTPQE